MPLIDRLSTAGREVVGIITRRTARPELAQAIARHPGVRAILDDVERDAVAHRAALRERLDALRKAGTGAEGRDAVAAVRAAEAAHRAAEAAVKAAAQTLQEAHAAAAALDARHAHEVGVLTKALRESCDPRVPAAAAALRDAWLAARHLPLGEFAAVAGLLQEAASDLERTALEAVPAADLDARLTAMLDRIARAATGIRDDRVTSALARARRAIDQGAEL